ncbi:MAG: hypothetical protein RQ741_02250 [Wenzhouxiangellaceae bacterium]|nr:hypothetical protein [Wenzhouxiangellaceae bacterium]
MPVEWIIFAIVRRLRMFAQRITWRSRNMNYIKRCSVSLFVCFLAACGADQSPAEFYVSVEQKWCAGHDPEALISDYYFQDSQTLRFARNFAREFASPSAALKDHCETFDVNRELQQTRIEEVGPGRYAIQGMTMNGQFRRIPHNWIVETGDGFRIKFDRRR